METISRDLFRGKRVDNGEWIIGNRIDSEVTGQIFIHMTGSNKDERDNIGKTGYSLFGYSMFVAFEVDPTTICRCTGRDDKNGKLIWEHDAVKYGDTDSYGYIGWNKDTASFVLIVGATSWEEPFYDYVDKMEVVGNRFDTEAQETTL